MCTRNSAYRLSFCVVFNSPPSFCSSLCHFPGVCGGSAQASGSGRPWQRWVERSPDTISDQFNKRFSLPVKWSERKGQLACFSDRYSLFLWRQQRDRVEQFVPALPVSTICSATQQQSVQLRDRRSTSLPFLPVVTRLLNHLLIVGSRPSHENPLVILPPGPGTGVPFHWHGPGFAEVIYGKKVNGDLDV